MTRRQVFGAAVAMAAAGLISNGAFGADQKEPGTKAEAPKKSVKCVGGNACKGKSECGVAGAHSCHTQNACKGKGWVMVSSEKECQELKAKNAEPKKS